METPMEPRRRMLSLVKLPICLVLLVVPLLLDYRVPVVLAASFTFTTIDIPGSLETWASGISGSGQIVGGFRVPHLGGLSGECYNLENVSGPSSFCQGYPTPPLVYAMSGPLLDSTYCIFDEPYDYFSGYCIYGVDSVGSPHGFLRSPDGSSSITFDLPGASSISTYGVNATGQVVGGNSVRNTDGSIIQIDVPGAIWEINVSGINVIGQIVGAFWDDSAVLHGFLRNTDGSLIQIDVPGAVETSASGISSSGQIVGSFQDASFGSHGFLRDTDGSFTTIDVPGAIYGINATGQIVGWLQDATGVHGFLRNTDGSFTTIDVPGAMGTWASGINDAGQIVGYFDDASGIRHGFVTRP